jgi:hypothetical protein
MAEKQKPFGEILVEAGVIDRDRLNQVLEIQKDNPHRTVGEIVSAAFGVPMEVIEAVFVQRILIPAIQDMLTEYLRREAEIHADSMPFAFNQLIYDIDVLSITLKRTVVTTFAKQPHEPTAMMLDGRNTVTEIGGKLRLTIKTQDDETICDPMDMLSYMYEFETGKAQFAESAMQGIRFLFSRKIREQLGETFVFQPIRKEELEDLLKQL